MTDLVTQARALLAAGKQSEAEALLRHHAENEVDSAAFLRDLLVTERRDAAAATLARRLAGNDSPEARTSQSLLALMAGDPERAKREARAALAVPGAPAAARVAALNHLGRALFNGGETGEALRALQQAAQLDPDNALLHNSIGHIERGQGNLPSAIEAYRQSIALCPGLTAARHNLGITLSHADRPQEALGAFEALLSRAPDHTGALVDSALTLMLLGRLAEARTRLEQALSLDPQLALAHLALGQLFNEQTDTERALTHLRRAVELAPDDAEAWIELTGVLEQANRESEAIEALRGGFAADPHHPGLHLEGAKLERRRDQSTAAVRRLRGVDPAGLPARMEQQYWFELGLNLDRDGQADAAIQAFERGNRLARQGVRSRAMDPDALEKRCRRLERWLDDGTPGMQSLSPTNGRGSRRCFLVGFPRSGTTLVDTTLATSEQVQALEEAPTLDGIIRDLEGLDPPYPAALARMSDVDELRHVEAYETRVSSLLGAPPRHWLIDKMPLRFLHAGLIQRLLPKARLIFVARHPCDVVLSNFMQQYAVNETNIHFDTLAHSVRTYTRLMGLWLRLEQVIDLPVTTLRYEDLVSDLAGALTPAIEALSLDPGTIRFDEQARLATRDRVRTSSYQQVGEPIYTRASGRWRRYAHHLSPWLPSLAPFIERYGYDH